MKGTLHKTEQGWIVRWPQEDPRDPKPELPVHPDDLDSGIIRWAEIGGLDDKEIEFDWCVIVTPEGKGTQYARLTKPKRNIDLQKLEAKFDKLISEETPESFHKWLESKRETANTPMVKRLREHLDSITPEQFQQEIDEIENELGIEDDTEKLAKEEVGWYDENDNDDVKRFVQGYNKAKETYHITLDKFIDLYIEETGYGMDMWSKEENEVMTIVAKIIEEYKKD